jgi:hypothetical protein
MIHCQSTERLHMAQESTLEGVESKEKDTVEGPLLHYQSRDTDDKDSEGTQALDQGRNSGIGLGGERSTRDNQRGYTRHTSNKKPQNRFYVTDDHQKPKHDHLN